MKTIKIGAWDGEQAEIQVEDTATISDALTSAGLTISNSQSVTTFSDARDVRLNDIVTDGETYLLTGNQVSGSHSFFTTIKTTKGVEYFGEPYLYHNLFNNSCEPALIRFSELLKSRGITKVVSTSTLLAPNSLYFDELTIVIAHTLQSEVELPGRQIIRTQDKFEFIVERVYKPFDPDAIRITYNNLPIGDYYKSRNCILLYFDLFPKIPRVRPFQSYLNIVLQNLNLVTLDISEKVSELNLVESIAQFAKHIDNTFNTNNSIIKSNYDRMGSLSREIIAKDQENTRLQVMQDNLISMKTNFNESFIKNLKELSELPFVVKYDVLKSYIKINFGEVVIPYLGKNYYIGEMTAHVFPTEVKFFNINNPAEGGAHHPHVSSDGNPCLGSFHNDITKILSSLQFKKLAIIIRQFLFTYNPKSPICHIEAWKESILAKNIKTPKVELPAGMTRRAILAYDRLNTVQRAAFAKRLADRNKGGIR